MANQSNESLNMPQKQRPANYGQLGVGASPKDYTDPKAQGQALVGITNTASLHDGGEDDDSSNGGYGSFVG